MEKHEFVERALMIYDHGGTRPHSSYIAILVEACDLDVEETFEERNESLLEGVSKELNISRTFRDGSGLITAHAAKITEEKLEDTEEPYWSLIYPQLFGIHERAAWKIMFEKMYDAFVN